MIDNEHNNNNTFDGSGNFSDSINSLLRSKSGNSNHSNWQGDNKVNHTFYALRSVGIIIVIYLTGGLILSMIADAIFPDWEGFEIYAQGFAQIVFILIPTIYFAMKSPLTLRVLLRWRRSNDDNCRSSFFELPTALTLGYAITGLIAFQFFANEYMILQERLIPEFIGSYYKELTELMNDLYRRLLGGQGTLDLLRALFIGAMIPAICEENLFRGFLQRSLEENNGMMKSILITSLIFSVIHFNPIAFIPLFVIGAYLGFLAYASGDLSLAIIIHFLNNSFAIFVMYSPQLSEVDKQAEGISIGAASLIMIAGVLIMIFASYQIYMRMTDQKSKRIRF